MGNSHYDEADRDRIHRDTDVADASRYRDPAHHGHSVIIGRTALGVANNVQAILLPGRPTGGTFILKGFTPAAWTSAPLPFSATAAQIRTALTTPTPMGVTPCTASQVTVTGVSVNPGPVTVTFGGTLQHRLIALMTTVATGLTGPKSPYEARVLRLATGEVRYPFYATRSLDLISTNGTNRRPTGGTFTLSGVELDGTPWTSAALPWNTTAADVQALLATHYDPDYFTVVGDGLPVQVLVNFAGIPRNQPVPAFTAVGTGLTGLDPAYSVRITLGGNATATAGPYRILQMGVALIETTDIGSAPLYSDSENYVHASNMGPRFPELGTKVKMRWWDGQWRFNY